MVQCKFCGYNNPTKFKSCKQCGKKFPKIISITPNVKSSNDYERPQQFTIILGILYLISIILGLVSVLIILITIAGIATTSVSLIEIIYSLLLGIIPLIIAGLVMFLTGELQYYNNKARIIFLILFAITLLISLVLLNFIGIVFTLFGIYTLLYDKKTTRLFS